MKKTLIAFLLMTTFTAFAQKQDKPDTITVDGTRFTLDPGFVEDTIYEGQEGKTFSFRITPVTDMRLHSYTFQIYGYGNGFPTFGIITDVSSGGANGIVYVKGTFTGRVFTLDNPGKKQTFTAKLPVQVGHGSMYGPEEGKMMYLPIRLTVLPKKK